MNRIKTSSNDTAAAAGQSGGASSVMNERPTRIGIFGRGRLGSAVAALVERTPGMELAWSAGSGDAPGKRADVVLDASASGAVSGHVGWAIESGTTLVIGTTGWDSSIVDTLDAEALSIGIMVAPNFSVSVAFMRRVALALGRFAAREPGADLSVLERHHAGKADAPSGTATLLAAALSDGSGRHRGWTTGRAEQGKINIASLRSGSTVGYHELRYEAPMENLVFSHEAFNRDVFARGAIEALLWIRGRRGIFRFDDMATEIIDGLFSPGRGSERNN